MTQPPNQYGPPQPEPGQPYYGHPQPGHPQPGHPQPGHSPYGPPQPGHPHQGQPHPPWGQPGMPPTPPPKKKSPVVFIVIGLVVLLTAAGILGTGLLWPGWMKSRPAVAVDQSSPESTAKAVEDALNRHDVDQFVNVLTCKDGRTKAEGKDISKAEEILYRDIEPFNPKKKSGVQPSSKVDEVRKIKPSDPIYNDGNKDATVAIMSVDYPKDSGLSKQRG
ncbi:MAG TPA: hypothetical protein VF821_09345, partial [Lentzea sp.]